MDLDIDMLEGSGIELPGDDEEKKTMAEEVAKRQEEEKKVHEACLAEMD